MKISAFKSLAIVALAAAPMLASAQLSANVSINSSYKFRGQDQTANKPALQGGFDYAHSSGFYVGNWNSNVTWLPGNSLESDIYAGYKGEVAGVGYDVGFLRYMYPGAGVANTNEIYGGVSYAGFGAKYSRTVSDQYFGGSKASYLSLSYSTEVAKGLTASVAVGFTDFKQGTDYTDYSVGLAYDLGEGYSVKGAFVGANKKNVYGDINKNRLVVTFAKAM
ncbi:MAG TPA: TorF family putative porin [Burkholderiaceae bacterium]|jgi:uncharacterized protein (TIGR02001 family)|nr:TorF family putative porin [Burkholderiaceae bacterium]